MVKVTGKNSKGKKLSKNLTCTITVKNPSLSVNATNVNISVGEKYSIKATAKPASATVKYSSSDKAVASVSSKGVVTGNKAGTATVTVTETCGTKKVTKKVTVNVKDEIKDGISVSLENEFSASYPGVVVSNYDINKDRRAILRVQYGRNGKGVNNEILHVRYTADGGQSYQTDLLKTDDVNGVDYWEVGCSNGLVAKVDYTITPEYDSSAKYEGSFSFASISTSNIVNVNGAAGYTGLGYNALTVSVNDAFGSTKGTGLTETRGTYTDVRVNVKDPYKIDYVNSQQVNVSGKETNKVGFKGGLPSITLPGNTGAMSSAVDFVQDVSKTSDIYHTYANNAEYITLNVDPSELTYATMHFSSLTLSKYTRLEISAYPTEADAKAGKNQIGTTTEVYGPHSQSDFAYQIPLANNTHKTMCIKVALVSAGQVDTDKNKGYVIKDITGVYKSQTSSNNQTETLKGAEIKWATVPVEYSEEKTLTAADVAALHLADNVNITVGSTDASTKKDVAKVTYRVPVFPYTGNAVITTYDKNGAVIAYFACSTINSGMYGTKYNENVLAQNLGVNNYAGNYVYRISVEEAFNNVGTVTQDKDLVTVNSDKAGVTNLKGTITGVPGLDATNSSVYTSVQWNPVEDKEAASTGAIAFAGQEVTVTAQLIDQNGNAVATAGQPVNFKYGNNVQINKGDKLNDAVVGAAQKVSVLQIQESTDSKGQAKLVLTAADANTVITKIQASTTKYNVVLKVNEANVETLDLYWIEAKPAFGPTASDEPAGKKDDKIETDLDDNTTCTPVIGENWEYAFTTANVTLPAAGVWSGKKVGITGAKVDVKVASGSKGEVKTDTGVNGMVTATSKEAGKTKLTGTVDGSAFDNNGVTFNVNGVGATKSVGEGKTSFSNSQKLDVNWQTTGVTGSFVNPNGTTATTGAAFTVYFKVADKLGNALDTQTVTVDSSEANSILSATGAVTVTSPAAVSANPAAITPSALGIVAIQLDGANKTNNQKETITVTLDGVAYTQTITWKASETADLDITTVNGGAVSSTNPYKTYADKDKIVLTFDHDIYAPANKDAFKKLFTVSRDKIDPSNLANTLLNPEVVKIGDVTVSGNTVTIKFDGTDNSVEQYQYEVKVAASVTDDGVTYNLTTTDGYVFSAKTFTLRDKYNADKGPLAV